MDPLWYKDAVIYELHVRSFCDGNNDGIGDFIGLSSKLDYVQELGVNTLWLLPFYESPLRDDGYDIADYRKILPVHGTLEDFRAFLDEAHERGLRVLTELVLNHTSDRHPWFQEARQPGSPKRDWYMWSDTAERYQGVRVIFKDFEHSNWQWDPVAGAYYWHRFFAHQPDLNWANPEVERALYEVLFYWLDMGVDGVRLDAVPYLYAREGTSCENLPETINAVRRLRAAVEQRYGPGRVLLAEANQWPEDTLPYFGEGEGDGVQMAYNFPLMPRMFMALKREDRGPIVQMLELTSDLPSTAQWALFLRNHDELTLEMVTEEERDYMYHEYAADPTYRLNLGIRRRLAPLLGGERRRIELMTSLLLALPGSPVIYYGDEIGMGDNPFLGDRNGVRTPMQWSADQNAGFSQAPYQRLFLPPMGEGPYSYRFVNVADCRADPHSLFHFVRRLLAIRNQHRTVFGRGDLEVLPVANRCILAFVREHEDQTILVAANLSRFAQAAELPLPQHRGRVPVELFASSPFPKLEAGRMPLTFGPHGFYWFALKEPEDIRIASADYEGTAELPTPRSLPRLDMEGGLESVLVDTMVRGDARDALERALSAFLPEQRWFGAKERTLESVRLYDAIRLGTQPALCYLTTLEVDFADGDKLRYLLPLGLVGDREAAARALAEAPQAGIAWVNGSPHHGLLLDAVALPTFWETLYARWRDGWRSRSLHGEYRAEPRARGALPALSGARRLTGEQSNSAAIVGDRVFLKLYRKLEEGPNPEGELLDALTRAEFPFAPALRGRFRFVRAGSSVELGVAQDFLAGAEDVWTLFVQATHRVLERTEGTPLPADATPSPEPLGESLPGWLDNVAGDTMKLSRLLGVRTAQLHLALFAELGGEATDARDSRALLGRLRERLAHVNGLLAGGGPRLELPTPLLERRMTDLAALADASGWSKIRIHGDFHLGQVVHREGEYYLLDFEGEPRRPLAERRQYDQALRDVAGMLRSFDYAGRIALRERLADHAESTQKAWMETLVDWSERVFLEAYRRSAADAPFLPPEPHFGTFLAALMLDKALYEVGYELSHRPEWVQVPLAGLERLARAG